MAEVQQPSVLAEATNKAFNELRRYTNKVATDIEVIKQSVAAPASGNGEYVESLVARLQTQTQDLVQRAARTHALSETVSFEQLIAKSQALYDANEATVGMIEDRLVHYGYTRTLTEATPCKPAVVAAASENVEDTEMPVAVEEASEEGALLEGAQKRPAASLVPPSPCFDDLGLSSAALGCLASGTPKDRAAKRAKAVASPQPFLASKQPEAMEVEMEDAPEPVTEDTGDAGLASTTPGDMDLLRCDETLGEEEEHATVSAVGGGHAVMQSSTKSRASGIEPPSPAMPMMASMSVSRSQACVDATVAPSPVAFTATPASKSARPAPPTPEPPLPMAATAEAIAVEEDHGTAPTPVVVAPPSVGGLSRSLSVSMAAAMEDIPAPAFSAQSLQVLQENVDAADAKEGLKATVAKEASVVEPEPPILEAVEAAPAPAVSTAALFTKMGAVGLEEYEAVPQYLRTQFSHASLNEAVTQINDLVNGKLGEEVDSVTEGELREGLGFGIRAQALLLLLKSCGRLTKQKNKETGSVMWLLQKR